MIIRGQQFAHLDPNASSVPWVFSSGFLTGAEQDRHIAISMNGRITAVSQAVPLDRKGNTYFSFVTPPEAVVAGTNQVQVFLLTGPPSAPRLSPLQVRLGA